LFIGFAPGRAEVHSETLMLNATWIRALAVAALAAVLASCSEEPPPPAEAARPVKTVVIEGAGGSGTREFPGRVDANRQAELSFRVGGTINAINVREGDAVREGQVLAELDKTDYQIRVDNQQAQFDIAEKNFLRAKDLVGSGAISKMDFDTLEARYKTSLANLQAARQDLAYATMSAPFGGVVARRHAENFEQVIANQKIFTLQDVERLEVKVDIPERLIRRLVPREDGVSASERRDTVSVVAYFPQDPARTYPLTLKEVATKADPNTQTFEVTFTMPPPESVTVLPGMTVSVRADLSSRMASVGTVLIPASAIAGNPSLETRVWVVDEQTMTVHPRPVRVAELEGGSIQVLEGLEGGDRVVVAGVGALADGMKVTLMRDAEQAEPREAFRGGE
jgi:RND family efflux transporter MFP subunit